MPSAISPIANVRGGNDLARPRITEPLVYSGSLYQYPHEDLTPVIGRQYTNLQAVDLLRSSESDRLIRDLAVIGD
jgi:hypothetical protein